MSYIYTDFDNWEKKIHSISFCKQGADISDLKGNEVLKIMFHSGLLYRFGISLASPNVLCSEFLPQKHEKKKIKNTVCTTRNTYLNKLLTCCKCPDLHLVCVK